MNRSLGKSLSRRTERCCGFDVASAFSVCSSCLRESALQCSNPSGIFSWESAVCDRNRAIKQRTKFIFICQLPQKGLGIDRKSTRLNSSHPSISYAVFCLKKKKKHK